MSNSRPLSCTRSTGLRFRRVKMPSIAPAVQTVSPWHHCFLVRHSATLRVPVTRNPSRVRTHAWRSSALLRPGNGSPSTPKRVRCGCRRRRAVSWRGRAEMRDVKLVDLMRDEPVRRKFALKIALLNSARPPARPPARAARARPERRVQRHPARLFAAACDGQDHGTSVRCAGNCPMRARDRDGGALDTHTRRCRPRRSRGAGPGSRPDRGACADRPMPVSVGGGGACS
jgi:hypothetical protein